MTQGNIVIPGDVISSDASYYLQGYGTFTNNGKLIASLLGDFDKVNQLGYVRPINGRYVAQVGDVIVGIVVEISGDKWLLDVGAAEKAQLSILQVNTEELATRRKDETDLYDMKKLFGIGNILCCEVQRVAVGGTIMLQTRTTRYGQLTNGVLVKVKPNLMLRQPKHIHDLDFGVKLVLGCNGYIWIAPSQQFTSDDELAQVYKCIITLKNIIALLAQHYIKINVPVILDLYRLNQQMHPETIALSNEQGINLICKYAQSKA